MNLSKRLSVVASFVEPGSVIADIGSDHCLLPIYLLEEGRICSAYAVENKKGPYKRMEEAIKASGFEDRITPLLSDGIRDIPDDVDTVVIAGMGGKLIKEIIEAHKEKLTHVNNIVVDAHCDADLVIESLSSLSFYLFDNSYFADKGISYDVMSWKRSLEPIEYTDLEVEFGPLNIGRKPTQWKEDLSGEKERLEQIIKNKNIDYQTKNKYIERIEHIFNVLGL